MPDVTSQATGFFGRPGPARHPLAMGGNCGDSRLNSLNAGRAWNKLGIEKGHQSSRGELGYQPHHRSRY